MRSLAPPPRARALRVALRTTFVAAIALAAPVIAGRHDDELAAIHRLQAEARWAAVDSLATTVLARLESEPKLDSLVVADVLAARVDSKLKRYAYRDSLASVLARRVLDIRRQCLRPDDLRIADAHHALAYVYGGWGRPDSAFVHAQREYDIRSNAPAPDDTLVAESLRLLGLASRDRADYRAAADYFARAFDRRLRVHDENRRVMARLLAEQGFVLRMLDELDQARAVLLHSLAIYERVGGYDDIERTIALDYLAMVERKSGNLAASLERSQEAVRVARLKYRDDQEDVFRIQRNMAATLEELGDHAGAVHVMQSVLPLYEQVLGATHPRTIGARNSLAIALVGAGDSVAAMRELRAVERALARPGPPDPLLGMNLEWQAELLGSQGDHPGALAILRRAIPIATAARSPMWSTVIELQVGLLRERVALGDTAGLEADRQELLRIAALHPLEATDIAQTVVLTDAMSLRALGRRDAAWARALEADRIARQRVQMNSRSLPERRSLQLSLQFSPTTDFVVDLARTGTDAERGRAWDALIGVRGLVRAEMARRRPPPEALTDTALASAHARWIAAQRRYAQRLVSSVADTATAAQVETLRAVAESAEREFVHALGDRARTRDPGDVTLADIRARLQPGQALVGFVETASTTDSARVTALVVRAGTSHIGWVDLGASAPLGQAIATWRERLATRPGTGEAAVVAARAERRAGLAVRARTWDRLAAELGDAREVFVVPDGPLVGLTWYALPLAAGHYLVETGPLLTVLDAERDLLDASRSSDNGSMLAVGAPDFGASRASAPVALVRLASSPDPCAGGLPTFAPLPGAGEEVRSIARSWRGKVQVLEGSEATEEAFKHAAPGHAVLHLATHGLVAGDTCAAAPAALRGVGGLEPLGSHHPPSPTPASGTPSLSPWLARRIWLALAGANDAASHTGDENEGLLTAEEVLTLDLDGTEWVVLSACRSGTGEAWSREGALGMRRAFHLAGAHTVIASQWSVEDGATREYMEALYGARAGGARRAGQALREASRTVLAHRRAAHRSTHPFYWAAFDATGD
jgi:tetratricopeptide (TPR) repeat protein